MNYYILKMYCLLNGPNKENKNIKEIYMYQVGVSVFVIVKQIENVIISYNTFDINIEKNIFWKIVFLLFAKSSRIIYWIKFGIFTDKHSFKWFQSFHSLIESCLFEWWWLPVFIFSFFAFYLSSFLFIVIVVCLWFDSV